MTEKQRQAWDDRLNVFWARLTDLKVKAEVERLPGPVIHALGQAESAMRDAESAFWALTEEA